MPLLAYAELRSAAPQLIRQTQIAPSSGAPDHLRGLKTPLGAEDHLHGLYSEPIHKRKTIRTTATNATGFLKHLLRSQPQTQPGIFGFGRLFPTTTFLRFRAEAEKGCMQSLHRKGQHAEPAPKRAACRSRTEKGSAQRKITATGMVDIFEQRHENA